MNMDILSAFEYINYEKVMYFHIIQLVFDLAYGILTPLTPISTPGAPILLTPLCVLKHP